MELLDLKLFCDVVDLKSFTEAAKLNHLTQSAVSQRINKLNEYYSGKLFLNKKKLVISWYGKFIYEKFKDILKIYAITEEVVHNKPVRDMIGIGFSENSKITYLQPQLINAMLEKNYMPEIYIGSSRSILEKIIFGILDYGIIGNRPTEISELIFNRIYCEKIVLATNKKNADKPVDIETIPMILDHRDSGLYLFLKERLGIIGVDIDRLNIRGYVGTSIDKNALLLKGEFYSFISERYIQGQPDLAVVPFDVELSRDFFEIYLAKNTIQLSFLRKIISKYNEAIS